MRRHVALCVLTISALYGLGCRGAEELQLEPVRRTVALGLVVAAPALPPPPVVPLPAEYHLTPLAGRLGGLSISEPQTHGNLTLYPVFASRPDYPRRIQTLEAAYQSKGLKLVDGRSGAIATISLDKTTGDEVFIMNGDMLVGGSQDRLTKADQLLPRKPGHYKLKAYCMELGRMRGPSKVFKAAGVIAPHNLRRMGVTRRDQSDIWKVIASKTAQVGAKNATKTLAAAYRTQRYHRLAGPYVKSFRRFVKRYPDAIGVAAVIRDTVVSVDLFANRRLFADSFPKLLRSFVLDATDPGFKTSGVAEPELIHFLSELRYAAYKKRPDARFGQSYGIRSARAVGSALVAHRDLVHLVLLPRSS